MKMNKKIMSVTIAVAMVVVAFAVILNVISSDDSSATTVNVDGFMFSFDTDFTYGTSGNIAIEDLQNLTATYDGTSKTITLKGNLNYLSENSATWTTFVNVYGGNPGLHHGIGFTVARVTDGDKISVAGGDEGLMSELEPNIVYIPDSVASSVTGNFDVIITPKDGEATTYHVNFSDCIKAQIGTGNKYFSIAEAITEAPADSTVKIVNNVSVTIPIEIDKAIALDLNGKVVDCSAMGAAGTAGKGAFHVSNGGSLTIDDSTPTVEHKGTVSSNLWIWDEEALSDVVTITGGIITGSHRSAVFNEGTLLFKAGNLVGNTGYDFERFGSAIYSTGTVTMSGGSIQYNKSYFNTDPTGYGGAIWTSGTTTIGAGSINNNYAYNDGAAIMIGGGSTTISGGTISNNSVGASPGINKSAIYVRTGSLEIKGSALIKDNLVETQIQVYMIDEPYVTVAPIFRMSGGTISETTPTSIGITNLGASSFEISGGTITGFTRGIYTGGDITITGGTISNCVESETYGGGIYLIDEASLEMSGGTITNCSAKCGGGGVSIANGTFTMSGNATISECSTTETGGAVYVANNMTFTISGNAVITQNTAGTGSETTTSGYGNGGGIWAGTGTTVNLNGGTISDNIAKGKYVDRFRDGGSNVYMRGGTVNVNGVTITGGTVQENCHGALIYANPEGSVVVNIKSDFEADGSIFVGYKDNTHFSSLNVMNGSKLIVKDEAIIDGSFATEGTGVFSVSNTGVLSIGGITYTGDNALKYASGTVELSKDDDNLTIEIKADATVNEDMALEGDVTLVIPINSSITVAANKSLVVNTAVIDNNGTIIVNGAITFSATAASSVKTVDTNVGIIGSGTVKVYEDGILTVNQGKSGSATSVSAIGSNTIVVYAGGFLNFVEYNEGTWNIVGTSASTSTPMGSDSGVAMIALTDEKSSVTIKATYASGAISSTAYTINGTASLGTSNATNNDYFTARADVVTIAKDSTLALTCDTVIGNGANFVVNGTLTVPETKMLTATSPINVGATGAIDGNGTIAFGDATDGFKVVKVAAGGKLNITLDGTNTGAEAKDSKIVLANIVAGEGGITVTKGSVIIDGVIATPDVNGKITVPAGSTVYVSGIVDAGVTLEIPATSTVVVQGGNSLVIEEGAAVVNNGTIDLNAAGSEVIYEKGSVINGEVIETTTKEDKSGRHVSIIIWLVSEDNEKLAISVPYVEAFAGATYGEILSLVQVTPLKKSVTFTGWYNTAMVEKIASNTVILPYEHTITACFDIEKKIPVIPDDDDDSGSSVVPADNSNINEFALPIAFILLVCSIFALGFVIIRKK